MTDFSSAPITDATIAEFTRQMQERGLDPSATLAKHGAQQQGAAPAPEPAPLAPDLIPAKTPRLSSADLVKGANTLAQHWTGDPAVLRDTLERLGLEETDDAADARTEVEQQFDATLGAPASADEYNLGDLFVNRAGLDPEGALEVSAAVRTALGELGVPKHLGPALGSAILDAVERSNATPGVEDAVRSNAEVSGACQVLGVGREALFATIKPLIARTSGETKELLRHAVAGGHDRALLVWLFRAAELGTIRKGLERTR